MVLLDALIFIVSVIVVVAAIAAVADGRDARRSTIKRLRKENNEYEVLMERIREMAYNYKGSPSVLNDLIINEIGLHHAKKIKEIGS